MRLHDEAIDEMALLDETEIVPHSVGDVSEATHCDVLMRICGKLTRDMRSCPDNPGLSAGHERASNQHSRGDEGRAHQGD